MEYKKVSPKINDMVDDNINKLGQLFPSAVKDGEVDFDALKQALGNFKEVGNEKYELTWAGKQNAKKVAQEDIVGKTLKFVPEDSKDADTTENLYIEGDNLEVLKLLRQNYYGSVKMIYIDPPYNTGNDFIYNDDFSMTKEESDVADGSVNEYGERFTVNSKSQNRYHANWLNMMYPRLRIAKELLEEDGVIFISIDDIEISNLRRICDEIFGQENFVSQFTRKGSGGRQDSKYFAVVHEYVLCYAKNILSFESGKEVKTDDKYPNFDSDKQRYYKTQLLRKWGENSRRIDRPNLYYAIKDPDGKDFYPMVTENEEGCWRWGKEKMFTAIQNGDVEFKKKDNSWIAYERIYEPLEGEEKTKLYTTIIDDIGNATGAALLKELFKDKIFDYPKPVDLIKRLLALGNVKNNQIVLDFFSGSATTAHAVMQYNAENRDTNKFIMVQLPEKIEVADPYQTICDIGKERIRRAGDRVIMENPQIDTGFKVFKVSDTNIKWNLQNEGEQMDLYTMDYTPDLMDFMPNTKDEDVVYEIMLRQRNVELSSKIEHIFGGGVQPYLPLCG